MTPRQQRFSSCCVGVEIARQIAARFRLTSYISGNIGPNSENIGDFLQITVKYDELAAIKILLAEIEPGRVSEYPPSDHRPTTTVHVHGTWHGQQLYLVMSKDDYEAIK